MQLKRFNTTLKHIIAVVLFVIIFGCGFSLAQKVHGKENLNKGAAIDFSISVASKESFFQVNKSYSKYYLSQFDKPLAAITIHHEASIENTNKEYIKTRILAMDNEGVYFSRLPGGMGGYINYGVYNNLYKLNFADGSLTEFPINGQGDIVFSPDLKQVVYRKGKGEITVLDLETYKEQSYELRPGKAGRAQIGSFMFSPDLTKVAVAVAYGPGDEHGEIYIINLTDGSYSLYKKISFVPYIKSWNRIKGKDEIMVVTLAEFYKK